MARANQRGLELSFKRFKPDSPRGRWVKIIDGKAKQFGTGNGVSDRDSYQAALTTYRAFVKDQTDEATGRKVVLSMGLPDGGMPT